MQRHSGSLVRSAVAVGRRRLCLAGLLAGLPLQRAAAAEPAVLRIQTIQSEPFGRVGPQGAGGLMYEIGQLIAQRAGLAAENHVVPYARTVLSLQNGSADMVLRFSNDELKAVAHQVAPVLALPTVLVSRREVPVPRLEALSQLSLAVPRSFPMPESLTSLAGLRLQWVNNNEHAIQMLMGGRVDAAYGSNLGLFGAARGAGPAHAGLCQTAAGGAPDLLAAPVTQKRDAGADRAVGQGRGGLAPRRQHQPALPAGAG